jgi:hypothetical protein
MEYLMTLSQLQNLESGEGKEIIMNDKYGFGRT